MAQTHEFKTEVRQLLNLMIHSLYSNKDIFLRELVANAADAIDKARFASVAHPELAREWKIVLRPDKDKKTLSISDNGIGMTETEMIENIGTIAQSGTKAFLKALEEKGEKADAPELIGQFGVGFYSAFMVADSVTVISKKSGSDDPAVRWTSKGEGTFDLEPDDRTEPGTEVILQLKADAERFLENWKISEVVARYSDFIAYPIILPTKKVNDDKTETVEDRVLNSAKAIWLRKPDEVTPDELKSFFAHVSHGAGSEFAKAIHISAEGVSEFKALIFLPREIPFNFFMPDFQKKGLQLYVKRVFISDNCEQLLPDYLRFVRGVVDSSDLPLNVSREILQENPIIARIQKGLVSRILSELKKMQENEPEAYTAFFKAFGKVLKEGIHSDFANAEKIKALAMYESLNRDPGELISLDQYVKEMPESQQDIYYITGEKREIVAANPALEFYRSRGCNVLFMTDPIDEWVMQSMIQFAKKQFKPVAKGDFEADAADKEKLEKTLQAAAEKFGKLVEFLGKLLADRGVSQVRFTGRLTDSPCCLVVEGGALSPQMERLFKAMNQDIPGSKRILELNPDHPVIAAMESLLDKDAASPALKEYAELLFEQALLAEGGALPDPGAFAKRLTALLLKGLGVNG